MIEHSILLTPGAQFELEEVEISKEREMVGLGLYYEPPQRRYVDHKECNHKYTRCWSCSL